MKTKTLTLTLEQIQKLQQQCQAYPIKEVQHAHFQAKLDQGHITAYVSGKVVFAGETALMYAQQFEDITSEHAGSDEVGTGDYFGPIVVTACLVKESDAAWLSQLTIMDSKQLTDDQVNQLAPRLMEKLTYSTLILDNQTYNRVHQTKNLNAIKAQLHQKAYDHLRRKLNGTLPNLVVIDQFTPKSSYYAYLDEDYDLPAFHFETKAENKYLAVACAAIIARYTFLQSLSQYSQKYQLPFPKGAGEGVDQFGNQLVKQYGIEILDKVAKVHFKNTARIKESVGII